MADDEYEGYSFDPTIDSVETEYGTFNKGDRFEVLQDNEDQGYYVGDDGEVIGFTKIGAGLFNPYPRTAVYAKFEGMDPIEVKPEDVQVLA